MSSTVEIVFKITQDVEEVNATAEGWDVNVPQLKKTRALT